MRRPVGRPAKAGLPSRALAAEPTFLNLDQPTEVIQPNIIKAIGRIIRMLASWADMAIFLTDHYLVMERGEFIALGLGKDMQVNGVRQLVAI